MKQYKVKHEIQYHDIIECITCALDARDTYTAGHSKRVSDMALRVCYVLRLKKKEIQKIHIAAHLHDIGKIGVPDVILLKEGRLEPEEWEQMKKHSEIGAEILSKSHYLGELKDIDIKADSVCVHGDGAKALLFVEKIRKTFVENEIEICHL